MVLRKKYLKKERYSFQHPLSPIFKAEVRYLVHAKMDSWDRQLMIK